VLSGAAGQETRLQARFLAAQLEALRSGGTNTSGLVSLLADGAFAAYTARIYFTLWKLTGRESWLNALSGEFPHSPEAVAAGSGGRTTAMWLLFPGREGLWPGEPTAAGPGPTGTVTETVAGTVLQAGLFSREENARALLEKLRGAGFSAGSLRQDRSGGLYTLVYVLPGPDINASIRELKTAGFESFPLALP
jgi:hypothetical protein